MPFPRIIAAGIVAAGALAGAAHAEMMEMTTQLSGAEEVPPVETSASGTAEISYDTDTRMVTWELEYSGLSGDATAAHIHGPAPAGENAPPVVTIENTASGSEGSAELTEEQAAALTAGNMYVNVHTAANPGGEIRGQIKAGM